VFPIEEEIARVDKHINYLISLDFLIGTPQPKYYAFRHEVIQQVTYERLLFEQRRELHKSIAEHFEIFYEKEDSSSYPILAYHWCKVIEHCGVNSTIDLNAFYKLMHYLKVSIGGMK